VNSLNISGPTAIIVFIVILWFGNSSTHGPGFTPGVVALFASIPLTNLHYLIWACFIVQGPIHQFQISVWVAWVDLTKTIFSRNNKQ